MTDQPLTGELVLFDPNNLKVFDKFESELAKLAEDNNKAIFNYEDPKGIKDAKSHIYTLKKSKSAVEKVRKHTKKESLDYGRAVDARAKEIAAQLDDMILIHQEPIDAIETLEKQRIEHHQKSIDMLKDAAMAFATEGTAELVSYRITQVEQFEADESLEEFQEQAKMLKAYALSELRDRRDQYVAAEAQAKEQREAYDKEQNRLREIREENIRKEAETKAKAEAEEAAKQEAENARRREQQIEQDKRDAIKKAKDAAKRKAANAKAREDKLKQEHQEALRQAKINADKERKRIEQEREEQERLDREEKEARGRDDANKLRVMTEAVKALVHYGCPEDQAAETVRLIALGKIPNLVIEY